MYHERIRYDVKRSMGKDGGLRGWLTVDGISELDGQVFSNGTKTLSDPFELGLSHGAVYAKLYPDRCVELRYKGEYKRLGFTRQKLMRPEDDDFFGKFKDGFVKGFGVGVKMR